MKEIKLNKTIVIGGVTYRCVKGSNCEKCALQGKDPCFSLMCYCGLREDKTDIIFKRVNNKDKAHYAILIIAIAMVIIIGFAKHYNL